MCFSYEIKQEVIRVTEKQKLFCEEYLISLNATQAAIKAERAAKKSKQKAKNAEQQYKELQDDVSSEKEKTTAAEKLKTIETAIAKLSDPQEQAVLRYKYILGLNENKICLKMHYEKSRIYQIHRSALKKIEEI